MRAPAQAIAKARSTQAPSAAAAPIRMLRRKCACGGTASAGPVCEHCAKKHKLQRRLAAYGRTPDAAPHIVREVLAEPGRSLDPDTRDRMEARFGHDFGQVRIHTDARAAQSARAVDSLAYTVGSRIVFAGGAYAPGSADGDRLLAHELAHTVQQRNAAPAPPGDLAIGPADDAAEREADAFATQASMAEPIRRVAPSTVQRQPDGTLFGTVPRLHLDMPPPMLIPPGSIREAYVLPAPPRLELTMPSLGTDSGPRFPSLLDERLTGPAPFTPVTIIRVPRCIPSTPLTWADFQGTAPASSRFSAETAFSIDPIDVQGNTMFQATLDRAASWVKPQFPNAADPTQNECPARIAQCETFFNGLTSGQTGTWRFGVGTCPAIPQNTPPAAATSLAECTSEIGAECNTHAPANSARLLAHEQGHWDIACVLANKADDALMAGRPLSSVSRTLARQARAQTRAYDGQTNHGCNAAQQAAWTTAIAGNLPAVTIQ